jgi:hypothetical protein
VIQALIIAVWSEWKDTHPDQFQKNKAAVTQAIENNLADKPLEPTDRLLT